MTHDDASDPDVPDPAARRRERVHQPTFPGMCAECGACLRTRPTMPVRYECMGLAFTERQCLPCRLAFDRHASAQNLVQRIEGRHGRGGATAVPCSLQHLAWRAAHAQ